METKEKKLKKELNKSKYNLTTYEVEQIVSAVLDLFKEEKMELERIEGMRKKLPEFGYSYGDDEIRIGYNQALDDVLSTLKEEVEE